jgi:hypothetical protein
MSSNYDRCPSCVKLAEDQATTHEGMLAQQRHLAALAAGEPVLVRGRIVTEHGTLFDRKDINVEIDRSLEASERRRRGW